MLKYFIAFSLFYSVTTQAFVFVEPYGGYRFGKAEKEYTILPGEVGESKTSGWGGGLRSGFMIMGPIFIAADATYHKVKMEAANEDSEESKGSQLMLGASGGFMLPGSLRVWGGYYFKNELELDATTTTPYKEKYYGKAWKAGLSFEMFPFTHLAVEYVKNDWEKYEGNAGEMSLEDQGIRKYDEDFYFISLTFPLGMGGGGSKKSSSSSYR